MPFLLTQMISTQVYQIQMKERVAMMVKQKTMTMMMMLPQMISWKQMNRPITILKPVKLNHL